MGGEDCFGEDAPADRRWRVLLQSGSREGEELRRVWHRLKEEEEQASAWLDEEVQLQGETGGRGRHLLRWKHSRQIDGGKGRYKCAASDQSLGVAPHPSKIHQASVGVDAKTQMLKCLASSYAWSRQLPLKC